MRDFTIFSKDQLRKIARSVERETDLFIDATKKFLPGDGRITGKVVYEAIRLHEESKKLAEKEGLSEIKGYHFRKEYIQNYKVQSNS